MSKKVGKKKYSFTIKIHQTLQSFLKEYGFNKHTTNIEEISQTLTYTDVTRKEHKCFISRIDPKGNKYNCFWDHHPIPFTNVLIGCPINYIPSTATRSYYSEMTKSNFSVRENVYSDECVSDKLVKDENDYYETDGVFCSLNCLLAFIEDNSKNPLYANSKMLFHKLYKKNITPAPSWRLLIPYGGNLTIEKFRENSNKLTYNNRGICRPYKPIGFAYEENIKI